jgi:hypothetical protein
VQAGVQLLKSRNNACDVPEHGSCHGMPHACDVPEHSSCHGMSHACDVPEHGSCHGMSRQIQFVCAIKLRARGHDKGNTLYHSVKSNDYATRQVRRLEQTNSSAQSFWRR